jgi:hypothetical protein
VAALLITTEAMVAELPKKPAAGPAMPPVRCIADPGPRSAAKKHVLRGANRAPFCFWRDFSTRHSVATRSVEPGIHNRGLSVGNIRIEINPLRIVLFDQTNLRVTPPVCTENLIQVDAVMESPKLAE